VPSLQVSDPGVTRVCSDLRRTAQPQSKSMCELYSLCNLILTARFQSSLIGRFICLTKEYNQPSQLWHSLAQGRSSLLEPLLTFSLMLLFWRLALYHFAVSSKDCYLNNKILSLLSYGSCPLKRIPVF